MPTGPARLRGLVVLTALALAAIPLGSADAASIFTVAGAAGGLGGCSDPYLPGEGSPSLGAPGTTVTDLCAASGLAVLPNGDLVFGAREKLVRLDALGVIQHLAGSSTSGDLGDGGPATAATLDMPLGAGIAVDATGGVLVPDRANGDRIRRIAPDGTITTVAGGDRPSFSAPAEVPDGSPATSGPLPAGALAVTPDGGFALVTPDGRRIRSVRPDGTVSTLAGLEGQPPLPGTITALAALTDGTLGFAADGGVYGLEGGGGFRALPGFPPDVVALAAAPAGAVLAATQSQAWLVEPSGTSRLVAGRSDGQPLDLVGRGDGRSPERAALSPRPGNSIAALGDGSFAMLDNPVDQGAGRIRLVTDIPSIRLAAEILPWTLASRGKVVVSYVATAAAQVTVSVRYRGREIAKAEGMAAPGKNVLRLPRSLPDGQNLITLEATGGAGEVAVDRMAMLPNGFLPGRAAQAVIPTGEDDSADPAGTPVGNAARAPHAADSYIVSHIVGCRRFSRARVDCVRHITDTASSPRDGVWTGSTIRLGRNGRIYVRHYANPGRSDRHPRFYRHPRWRDRVVATAPPLVILEPGRR